MDKIWNIIIFGMPAWIALLLSIGSIIIAKKSYEISKEQETRNQPKLGLYLDNSFSLPLENESFTLYAFSLLMSNYSDTNNSIKMLELIVRYEKEGEFYDLIIAHNNSNDYSDKLSPFHVPTEISPRNSIHGWALFKIDKVFLNNNIDSYTVQVTDTFGNISNVEQFIINEETYYEEMEEKENKTK